MRLSLLGILEATGGGEVGGTQVGETFSTFHTDSREVRSGGLFFALRGAEKDGHQFVGDAIARGAAAVVVDHRTEFPSGVVEVLVPDTWKALYALAAHALRRVQPLVVAVTGSNGKTSTKEMVAAILAQSFNVMHTQGNLNTETGVPLTILSLEPHHSGLVLEMGMQQAGDIARLAALAKPAIGIVTNVGVVHIEFFSSREDIARAKGELVAALPEEGLAVLGGIVVEHRLQEVATPGGYSIIDDAYNASPESMLAAFDTVAGAPKRGRLLAVLGEMRELGALAAESHRRVGQRAAEVFDAVCVIQGDHSRVLAEAAGAEVVPDREAAAEWVRRNAAPGDRVLIKASHGVRLDELVRDLTAT